MPAFHSSHTKSRIRKLWDLPVLKIWKKQAGHSLSYFGMPGPEIEDLIDWSTVLGPKTCIERLRPSGKAHEEDLEAHSRILANAFVNNLDTDLQLLRGDVEDIILKGMDLDGHVPAQQEGTTLEDLRFRYDLCQLDFLGGVGYKDKRTGTSKRLRAMKQLLQRQSGHDFVLLLTINVRDNMHDELTLYLKERAHKYAGDRQLRQSLEWYSELAERCKALKLKAAVPLFIQEEAEVLAAFKCYAYPPVCYTGTGHATMIHFAFNLFHEHGRDTPVLSPQTPKELLKLPLIEATEDGFHLSLLQAQDPGLDRADCGKHLLFLPPSTRRTVKIAMD